MKLAVFYHCKLSGEGIPDNDAAIVLLCHQMHALKASGLAVQAQEIHLGINGTDGDALLAGCFSPPRSVLHVHGSGARTEIPTLNLLREWLPSHPDWHALYHHAKGVTHPRDEFYARWRQRMENACVWNWQRCVTDLEKGYEAVGCHWLTPQQFPGTVTSPFFGGTFWWARSEYLAQLPPLPEPTWANRYEAESWIGRRRPYPRVMDYYPGWP